MNRYVALLFVSFFIVTYAEEQGSVFNAEIDQQCNLVKSGRIVAGEEAPEGAFPYQVSLRRFNSHFCGGSIIGNRWILTAAHCLQNINVEKVVVGTNTLSWGGDSYNVARTIIHPQYSIVNIVNDVGLIELTENIRFNNRVQPVKIPTEDSDKHNYPAIATGWGRISAGGPLPNKMQFLRTCLMNKETCSRKVNTKNLFQKICTFTHFGQGVCNGDSGSPLTADGVQIGIASYVIYNCAMGYPDFFTRVASYTTWIKQQTGIN